jgi:hypothetical protein
MAYIAGSTTETFQTEFFVILVSEKQLGEADRDAITISSH